MDWTMGRQEVRRSEEELDTGAVCHGPYSAYIGSTLPKKLLKGLETSKQGDK